MERNKKIELLMGVLAGKVNPNALATRKIVVYLGNADLAGNGIDNNHRMSVNGVIIPTNEIFTCLFNPLVDDANDSVEVIRL